MGIPQGDAELTEPTQNSWTNKGEYVKLYRR